MKNKNTTTEAENNMPFKVRITTGHNGIPEGSVVRVEKELKYSYKGIWSSMMGSYTVKVLKKYCEIKK
jgi:hypothetical protein